MVSIANIGLKTIGRSPGSAGADASPDRPAAQTIGIDNAVRKMRLVRVTPDAGSTLDVVWNERLVPSGAAEDQEMTETLVETFKPDDTATQANPYPYYPLLRDLEPALESSFKGQRCWILSRRDDIVAVLMDPVTYSSIGSATSSMLGRDPPEHDRLRAMVTHVFSPQAVQVHADAVLDRANHLIGPALEAGRLEVNDEYASPLTVHMISKILGMREEDVQTIFVLGRHRALADYVNDKRLGRTPSPEAQRRADALHQHILGTALGGGCEAGDVVDQLAKRRRAGELTDEELIDFVTLLFSAGHSTTTHLIGNALYVLTQRPQDVERIRVEEGFVARFLEEVLRTRPSFHRIQRVTTREVVLHGVTVPAGSVVRLLLASANRDPTLVPDAEVFDPDRRGRMHIAFGQGIHFCLGSWLAKLEASIALRVVAHHVSGLRLDPQDPPVPYTGGTFNAFGFDRLPLRLALRPDLAAPA
jgi:cytochrome P450